MKLSLKAKFIYFPAFPRGWESPVLSFDTPHSLIPSSVRSMRQGHLLDAFSFLELERERKAKPTHNFTSTLCSLSPRARLV